MRPARMYAARAAQLQRRAVLLCVCYLENRVSRGTRIDQKISARVVPNSTVSTARLFQLGHAKIFLPRCSWSRVIGTASPPMFECPERWAVTNDSWWELRDRRVRF